MKKYKIIFYCTILFNLLFSFFSCTKKIEDIANNTDNVQTEEIKKENLQEETEEIIEATVLSPKTYLYLLGRDNKMHKILKLLCNEKIFSIYINKKAETIEFENVIYIKSIYDEVEYWININDIALQCKKALVLENTILYADKEFLLTTDEKNSPFEFGQFIYISTNEEDKSDFFYKTFYYDKNSNKVKFAYIKKDSISTQIDDLVVMECIIQLRQTKRAILRNEFFNKAAKYKPCAKISNALEDEKTEKIENNYQDVLNALPGAKYKVNVPELLTVDQSKDPFK